MTKMSSKQNVKGSTMKAFAKESKEAEESFEQFMRKFLESGEATTYNVAIMQLREEIDDIIAEQMNDTGDAESRLLDKEDCEFFVDMRDKHPALFSHVFSQVFTGVGSRKSYMQDMQDRVTAWFNAHPEERKYAVDQNGIPDWEVARDAADRGDAPCLGKVVDDITKVSRTHAIAIIFTFASIAKVWLKVAGDAETIISRVERELIDKDSDN